MAGMLKLKWKHTKQKKESKKMNNNYIQSGASVAIETKYLAPTNTRGARVKAIKRDHKNISTTINWDYEKTDKQDHETACKALLEKMGNPGKSWRGGWTNTGMVFVHVMD